MKRIISVLLVIIMSLGINVFADDKTDKIFEVSREEKILSALGINIPVSESAAQGEGIRRAEAAKAFVDMLGYDVWTDISTSEVNFKDVKANHNMAKSIYALNALGIMSGDGEYFRPDDALTFNEAFACIIRILGYGDIAQAKGGFISGYMKLANELNLMKGIKTSTQSISREQFSKLLFNALEAPIADATSYVKDYGIYEINKSETLLTKYLDGIKAKGVLSATEHSSLKAGKNAPEGCVIIDGVCYKAGKTDAELYLGYDVIAYARLLNENDEYKTIVYFEPDANTDMLRINKRDVNFVSGFDASDASYYKKTPVIKYTDSSNKSGEIKISAKAVISYNGIVTDNIENSDFINDIGEITFIDTDNSGGYDYIAISSFKTYVIDRIDLDNNQIYTKSGGVVLTLDNSKKSVKIFKYGKKADINALRYDDVISVAVEKLSLQSDIDETKVVYIYASSKTIEARAQSIDNQEYKVEIADEIYNIFPSLTSRINMNISQKFYVDVFGNICDIDVATQEESEYGYLIAFGKERAMSDDMLIKLFELDEQTHIYGIAERVKYTGFDSNGNWVEGKSFDKKKMNDILTASFSSPQLIKFNVDEENRICRIIQAKDMESVENYGGFSYEEFTLEEAALAGEMVIQNNMITESYRMDSKTSVIILPQSGDEEDYVVGNGDTLFSVKDVLVDAKIYDSSDTLNAGVVVATVSAAVTGGSLNDNFVESGLFVVDKVVMARNENDEFKYRVTGMMNGKQRSYFAKGDDVEDTWKDRTGTDGTPWSNYNTKTKLSELSLGDIVLLQTNSAGEITNLLILFSFDNTLPQSSWDAYYTQGESFGTLLNTHYGKITNNYKNKTLRIDGFATRKFAMTGNLYMCDLENKELRIGLPQEIRDTEFTNYDYAFIRSRKNEVKDIVIFRR